MIVRWTEKAFLSLKRITHHIAGDNPQADAEEHKLAQGWPLSSAAFYHLAASASHPLDPVFLPLINTALT